MSECILLLSEHLPPHHPRCFQAWSTTSSHDGTHETESHEVSLLGSRFTVCHLAVCFSPVLFVAISQYINSSIVTTVVVHCNYPTILLLKCVVTIVRSYTQVCQGNRMHFRDQLTIDCHILSYHQQKQKQSFCIMYLWIQIFLINVPLRYCRFDSISSEGAGETFSKNIIKEKFLMLNVGLLILLYLTNQALQVDTLPQGDWRTTKWSRSVTRAKVQRRKSREHRRRWLLPH